MMRRLRGIPSVGRRGISGASARGFQNVLTAFVQIGANKGRSLLTTLGIIIAVTSTITVVSLVQGFGKFMTDKVRGYGTQFMVVRPYTPPELRRAGMGRITLDMADVDAVRYECPALSRISPFVYTHDAEVAYGSAKAQSVPMRGVSEHYQTIRSFFVDAGRFFGPIDVEGAAKVVVLGRTVVELLESDDSIVGDSINIDGTRFLVIGLLASKGGMMEEDQDKTIMIPYSTAVQMYPRNRAALFFLAEAAGEEEIPLAEAQIRRVLRRRHGLAAGQPDDFRIDRQDQMLKAFSKMRDVASGVLSGIVSISLLVGGIGIMNMMLVSVTERTNEIGLRKSVGGRRRDILLQFLTESVILCTVAGVLGVLLGYFVTHVASLHPRMVDVSVPWWSVALALGFSAGTGVIFGIIPAFKAALLHPIDALRHE